ncbi:glycyl-radical enzyme activating protein [Shewanella sp. GXUN23E]|uniref:glycyl-radical enzyme activating protein n=1 Tax=Shewanella sp. GXUN23E TaxID=3422498 RepID=UPI003D7DFF43
MNVDNNNQLVGHVFNIQRYSLHDGPGIRTTVFLKGCPLRCFWCQNPESQSLKPTLMFRQDKCTSCGRCIDVCPHDANSIVDGKMVVDRSRCTGCGACAAPGVCLNETRKVEGKSMTVKEVMDLVTSDYNLYENSGGGLTVSGGDCAMQPEFTAALLEEAHKNVINTCVEISGAFPWKTIQKITEHADYIYYDLKCMDDQKHIEGTRISNKHVLENARKLVEMGKRMHFRTPLIPDFNDSKENIRATALFIRDDLGLNPAEHFELLPYNNLGEEKYVRIGIESPRRNKRQSDEYIRELNELIASI